MTILLTIFGLLATIVVVGYLLPVRYEGRTVVEFDRDASAVWEALQDVDAHPMTGKMKKSVERLPDEEGRPTWKEDMGHGEVITVTTPVHEPPRRMVRVMSAGATRMTSRWEYALEPLAEGCRVTLAGVTDIERGTWHTPLFRVMMIVGGGVKRGLDIQLRMVAASLGAGARS